MKPSGLFYNGGPGTFGVKSAVKVDQQALEEVHVLYIVYTCTCIVYVYTLNEGLFYIAGRAWVTVPVFPHFALNVESQKHGEVHIRLLIYPVSIQHMVCTCTPEVAIFL